MKINVLNDYDYVCIMKIFVILLISTAVHALAQEQPTDRGYIVKVGDKAPAFQFDLPGGETITSEMLKGKVVMLQFTASWCSVCRKEMPFIESEIWQIYKDKGLALYGVDYDEPAEKLKTFAESTGITYPLALDPAGDVFALFARKQSGVTRNVIIDREGNIVFLTRLFDRAEFDAMKDVIRKLLEESE